MAFVEIVILWLAIVATIVAFFQKSQVAGWLMVPYLAWVRRFVMGKARGEALTSWPVRPQDGVGRDRG